MHHQLPVIIQQPPIRLKPWRRNAPSSWKIWIESTGGKRLLEEELNMKSKNSCRCEPSPRLFDTYSRYYMILSNVLYIIYVCMYVYIYICLWCFGLASSGAPCDTALQNVMLVLFWVSWLKSISQFTCLQVTVLYVYIYICNNMYTYSPLPKYPHKSHKKCGESHLSQAPRSTRLWEFRLCVEMLRDCLDSFSTHGLGPRGARGWEGHFWWMLVLGWNDPNL